MKKTTSKKRLVTKRKIAPKEQNSFYAIAKRLGHSATALRAGKTVNSVIKVVSVDALRELLHDGADPKSRGIRAKNIFKNFPSTSKKEDVEGLLHRVEAFVYGDRPLNKTDRRMIKNLFPLEILASSAENVKLSPGEVMDLTDTKPVLKNIGTLTMESGSSIKVNNTNLTLNITTLVNNTTGSTVGPGYQLGIFGATGGAGATGTTGGVGSTGGVGTKGTCKSGGGISGDAGGSGCTGGKGGTGGVGNTGSPGLASLSANITISTGITGSTNQFVIETKSGTGGVGGVGGLGGAGGTGGQGGKGANCGCEGTNGGNGGKGGQQGAGGTGGVGGPGSAGSDIYVNVPKGLTNKIAPPVRKSAPPGDGGTGGVAGAKGKGGSGGGKGKHNESGNSGGDGELNSGGIHGANGTQSGNAGQVYVNELS